MTKVLRFIESAKLFVNFLKRFLQQSFTNAFLLLTDYRELLVSIFTRSHSRVSLEKFVEHGWVGKM